MTDITIPPEALEAAAIELWEKNGYIVMEDARDMARAAIRAAIKAWPGMATSPDYPHPKFRMRPMIFLPLTKEGACG